MPTMSGSKKRIRRARKEGGIRLTAAIARRASVGSPKSQGLPEGSPTIRRIEQIAHPSFSPAGRRWIGLESLL
jgi:hypothetical protein